MFSLFIQRMREKRNEFKTKFADVNKITNSHKKCRKFVLISYKANRFQNNYGKSVEFNRNIIELLINCLRIICEWNLIAKYKYNRLDINTAQYTKRRQIKDVKLNTSERYMMTGMCLTFALCQLFCACADLRFMFLSEIFVTVKRTWRRFFENWDWSTHFIVENQLIYFK